MDRKWIYQDDSGVEYGPYTREELLNYSGQGRISQTGRIREDGGEWMSAAQLLPLPEGDRLEHLGATDPAKPPAPSPPTERTTAEKSVNSIKPRQMLLLTLRTAPMTGLSISEDQCRT